MKIDKKHLLAIWSVLLLCGSAYADGIISTKPLIANVNTSVAGPEVIMPHFVAKDLNNDGQMDTLGYRNDVYRNGTNNKLYNSYIKQTTLPESSCTNPYWTDNDFDEPVFARLGKWVATGIPLYSECEGQSGYDEAYKSFVYMADTSKAGGIVRTFIIDNAELKSLELLDYNGDGVTNLMMVFLIESNDKYYMRTVVKNIATWATIANAIYLVSEDM